MAGAKMLSNYPTSIVVHGIALNITVQTYNESLEMGIIACAQALPEVDELAAHIESAFLELKALPAAAAEVAAPVVVPKASPRKATKKAPARKAAPKKVAAKKPAPGSAPKTTRAPRASAPTAKRASR